jgi:hypothetical protein
MFRKRVSIPRLFTEGRRSNDELSKINRESAIRCANVKVLAVGVEKRKEPHAKIKD